MKQIKSAAQRRKIPCYGLSLGLLLIAPLIACGQAIYLDRLTRQRAQTYEPLFQTIARQERVDARLLWTIAYLESRFRPAAISPQGARGLMQLMPATARRWGVQNPFEPQQAIGGAARYLQFLGERFTWRVDLMLAAYNAGESAVDAYRVGRSIRVGRKIINPMQRRTDGVPPYRETRAYVSTGMALLRSSAPFHRTKNSSALPAAKNTAAPTAPRRQSIFYAASEIAADDTRTVHSQPRSIAF